MLDDSTSVFDDTPDPSSTPVTEAEQPSKQGPGPFKMGVFIMCGFHVIAWLLAMAGMFGSTSSIHGIKDILGPALLALGMVFAFIQWLYGVPLVLTGLGIGFVKQQWYFLLGVLLVLGISFALAFPICGVAVFTSGM